MQTPTCTRRLAFDAAHRITRHGSKCRNLHGHRYVFEVTAGAAALDELGMVIDFGVVRERVGGWIDEVLDHGVILNRDDRVEVGPGASVAFADLCRAQGWKTFVVDGEPTVENLALVLKAEAARLLEGHGIEVVRVRLYETPNCWADA